MTDTANETLDDVAAVQQLRDAAARILSQVGQAIVGQRQAVEELLIAMLAFIRLDVGARILQGVWRRKDRARQPQQMV